jgi:hypothetical protein
VGGEEGRREGRRTRGPDALTGSTLIARYRDPLRAAGGACLAVAKLATTAFTAEAAMRPDDPKYKGKGMRIRAVGYLGGMALVPAWWILNGRRGRYPVAADLAVTVPLLIDAGGNALGIYDEARIDDLVHGVNAGVLSALFGALISTRVESREVAAGATLAFGVIGELAWEAMEYAADAIGFKGLGLSHEDTVADIALASLGAVVAAGVTWVRFQPPREAPLVNIP